MQLFLRRRRLRSCRAAAVFLLAAAILPLPIPTELHATSLPASRLRIRITERGIYEIPASQLVAAGLPVSDPAFDARNLRLFFDRWHAAPLFADSVPASWQHDDEMVEAAIRITGEEDGALNVGERLLFYALGPAGWEDFAGGTDSLAYSEHPYDRYEYAWLVWDSQPGLRMDAVSAAVPEPLHDPLVRRARHRAHCERDEFAVRSGDLLAWTKLRSDVPASIPFDLDLAREAAATGTIRIQLGYDFNAFGPVEVSLNGALLGSTPRGSGASGRFEFANAPLHEHNTLSLRVTGGFGGLFLFELDAVWSRPLATDFRGHLEWSARPTTAAEVYEVQGAGSVQPVALDVTDPRRPVRLADATWVPAARSWRLRHGRGVGIPAHYALSATPHRLDPEDFELRSVAPLRSRATCPDMLIVTHPDLLPAAERLAAYRRTHLPGVPDADVLVTTTRDIYDNFSGGRQDPLAIRNWIKFLYSLSSEARLGYVLLLGDATFDPRQLLPGTPPTLVPTVNPILADARVPRPHAVEDWFAAMHSPPAQPWVPHADAAVGRLPARDLAEAHVMVDKILAYEDNASLGPWRGRVLMAADDECTPIGGCEFSVFVNQSEECAARIPSGLDIRKIYMTEYPRVGSTKPEARAALIREWNAGAVLFNFTGFAGWGQLADEELLRTSDVPLLTNGARLPVALPFHDMEAEFDRVDVQTIQEALVAAPGGGAVAAIGSSTFAYISPAYAFMNRQFSELFRDGASVRQPLGVSLQRAKGTGMALNEQYVLLGDPALVLQFPQAAITLTDADSLFAGRRARVRGFVHLPGSTQLLTNFDGEAEVEVLGNADESGYRRPGSPDLVIPYILSGAPLYRGRVPVRRGELAFEFTVPLSGITKSARLGPGGRVAAYAWNGVMDAKGGRDGVVLTQGGAPDPSAAPPAIRLAFPGGAERVVAGVLLTAMIADENGIAIMGASPSNSIRLQFDGTDPIDVTGLYRAQGESGATGSLSFPVPDLTPGFHLATLTAADNLGNEAQARLQFEVIGSALSQLTGFRAGPNPSRSDASFAFLLDVPADIDLRIFRADGRQVFSTRSHHDGLRRGSVRWDGRTATGHAARSGVYFYRFEARRPGAVAETRTGKITLLR